jgi:Tfp pilus assembly protein PilV
MTMLEVLMALGLLSLAALAVIGIFPSMARLSKSSVMATQMVYAGQQKIEQLVANNAFISSSYTTDYPYGTNNGSYRRWRGLADAYGSSAVQVIEVEVGWTEGQRTRKIVLHALVAP